MQKALRSVIISPDQELAQYLSRIFLEVGGLELGGVSVVRLMDRYPNQIDLTRMLRSHAPQVVFLSIERAMSATAIASQIDKLMPGVQVVAVGRSCEPATLMEIMRAGIQEFLAAPFEYSCLQDCLRRVTANLSRRPIVSQSTDLLYSFLPAKPGVGATTLALNASIAAARTQRAEGLLMDFDLNCGMIRFLLKLENSYSTLDAAEHASNMDENLWPQIVTKCEGLDVVNAGVISPESRIPNTQIHHLLDYARRNYKFVCADLSGNLEKYSMEIMQESRMIFLVCTTEGSSLHLAKEKLQYLQRMDLGDRVQVLLNRYTRKSGVPPAEVEKIVGAPVLMTFPDDCSRVAKSIQAGGSIDADCELGRSCSKLGEQMLGTKAPHAPLAKRRFVEYFDITTARFGFEWGKQVDPVM